MPTSHAKAEWKGNLAKGQGLMELGGGGFKGRYSAASRFENGDGTNPEELIGAAHAGCFSMALSHGLSQAGHEPDYVRTKAAVKLERGDAGFSITTIGLETEAKVPGITADEFQKFAQDAKANCPVSRALAAVEITLKASLND